MSSSEEEWKEIILVEQKLSAYLNKKKKKEGIPDIFFHLQ